MSAPGCSCIGPAPRQASKRKSSSPLGLPPHSFSPTVPCLCSWVFGKEWEVKGQACLMAVRAAPHHPTHPSSIPLMLSLGWAMGPCLALSCCNRNGGEGRGLEGPKPQSFWSTASCPCPQATAMGSPPAATLPLEGQSCCDHCKCADFCPGSILEGFQLIYSSWGGPWGQGQILTRLGPSPTRLAHQGMLSPRLALLWPWG